MRDRGESRDRGGRWGGRLATSLLSRLGFDVVGVVPGTVLVTRRRGRAPRTQHRRLAPGVHLITSPKAARRHFVEVQRGLYRFLAREHIAWMLRTYRVNCVVDVGANIGQYGLALRRAGYKGRIASFEPLPDLQERLCEATADDPDWHVYAVALGAEDGETQMNVVSGTLSSMLTPSEFGRQRHRRLRRMEPRQVPVRRLDGMLDRVLDGIEAPRPYLKLDTQGFDLEVFRGLGDRVAEFVGMQSEVALVRVYEGMARMPQAVETYEAAGFEITGMFPVSREERTARVTEYDCVMVRPSAA